MTDPRKELRELEELLPWYVNGRLGGDERERVQAALRDHPELRQRLDEVVAAMELALERPSSATLAAHAAGDLDAREAAAVDAYLADSTEDAELVRLARTALRELAAAPRSSAEVAAFPRRATADLWRWWAVAASLAAFVTSWGWWEAAQSAGERRAAVAEVLVLELLPEELLLRGPDHQPVEVDGDRTAVALVLVTERTTPGEAVAVSLRGVDGSEIARIGDLVVADDGSLSLVMDPSRLADVAELVLLRVGASGAPVELHRFRLEVRGGS